MKAVMCRRYGPPEVLSLEDIPKPRPKKNEVLIKVRAATVFAGDCEVRAFKFPAWSWLPLRIMMGLTKPRWPVLGQELAGEIEAVGANVTTFKPGDKVFAALEFGFGAHAEYKCMSARGPIAPLPANMSFEEAAGIPVGGVNALHFLERANIQPGQRVLINGAAGSIGSVGVQLAKYYGAEVTAVDSAEKLDVLRTLGADHVIDYVREDFTKRGEIYDVIFDVVGKSPYGRSLKCLTPRGHYLLANPRLTPMLRSLWTSATSDQNVMVAYAGASADTMRQLKELIEAGYIKAIIDKRFALSEAAEAHRYVDAGHKKGTVVLAVEHLD